MTSLALKAVAKYFLRIGNDEQGEIWHCLETGFNVRYAILAYYRSIGNTGYNGLTLLGFPHSPEIALSCGKPGRLVVAQVFQCGIVVYDPTRLLWCPIECQDKCY